MSVELRHNPDSDSPYRPLDINPPRLYDPRYGERNDISPPSPLDTDGPEAKRQLAHQGEERPEEPPQDQAEQQRIRPRAYDDSYKRQAIVMISKGLKLTTVAECLGCSLSTLYNWLRNDPRFQGRVAEIRYRDARHPMEQIRRAADTNWRAACYLLERAEKSPRHGKTLMNNMTIRLRLLFQSQLQKIELVSDEAERDALRELVRAQVVWLEREMRELVPGVKVELL